MDLLAVQVSSSSSSSSASSLSMAGTRTADSQTDCTPLHSPKLEKDELPAQDGEQVSHSDVEITPKFSSPVSARSNSFTWHLIALEEPDDDGYEAEPEDQGSTKIKTRKVDHRRHGSDVLLHLRRRSGSAVPEAQSAVTPASPMAIDNTSLQVHKIPTSKAPVGLGLGLPSNHPLRTARAVTAPQTGTENRRVSPPSLLLPSQPFPPSLSLLRNEMKIRIHPTLLCETPSPIDMLPPCVSHAHAQPLAQPLARIPSLTPANSRVSISPSSSLISPLMSSLFSPSRRPASDHAFLIIADQINPRSPCLQPSIPHNPYFASSPI